MASTESTEMPSVTVPLEKIQEFLSWRRKIEPLIQLLDKSPDSELEIMICCTENKLENSDKFLLDVKLAEKCQILYDELLLKVNEKEKESDEVWKDLQVMFKRLKDKKEFQLGFTSADSGVIKSMYNFKAQLLLREDDMAKRIKVFIGELRKDIADIWEQCMITDEEKAAFKEYHLDIYTEEMLDIHKQELAKWQVYHKKNQEILTMVTKREEMWVKLRELEAKADDPNRFVNRGGALLKDQNMHNSITKNLPKLEAELIKLAKKFEHEHDRKMKIRGKEIPLMIDDEWKLFKDEKAAKKLNRQFLTPSAAAPTRIDSATASVPLRVTRLSVMPHLPPLIHPASSKVGEKRPGSRIPGQSTPLSKRKFIASSTESINN